MDGAGMRGVFMRTMTMWIALAMIAAGCGDSEKPDPVKGSSTPPGPDANKGDGDQLATARKARDRAAIFLKKMQKENGLFTIKIKGHEIPEEYHVALTSMVCLALGDAGGASANDPEIEKALAFVVGNLNDSGAIVAGNKGYENYNTALALLALVRLGGGRYAEAIKKARDFLEGSQHLSGGISYNSNKQKKGPDLPNTVSTLEALKAAGLKADNPVMQRHAAGLAVLGLRKPHLTTPQVNIAPVQIDRLRDAGSGVEQEHHQRPKVRGASVDQMLGFVRPQPPHSPPRLPRPLDLPVLAQAAFGRVM